MIKEKKLELNNLLCALLFLVLGIILLTRQADVLGIASKVIGALLIIIGIVKCIIYIYMKGKLGDYKFLELSIGIFLICIGTSLVLFSETLSFAIKLIVGLWAMIAGINRIIFAITIKQYDKSGFKLCLITSLIMIVVGCLLISGLVDQVIGLLIILYSITEIVDYIYFKSKNKDYEPAKKSTKKTKKIKNKKVVDAIIEEEK